MEKAEEYTFVTIDNGDFMDASESFIVDVESDTLSFDAVMLDDDMSGSDLITLSDDTVFMTDIHDGTKFLLCHGIWLGIGIYMKQK